MRLEHLLATCLLTVQMGNGVSVKYGSVNSVNINGRKSDVTYDLAEIEKLCRNGYFEQNTTNLTQAVQLSIERDALDILEILLTVRTVRNINPLHFASIIGRLEAVELLVSAGFACNITDESGRTPLHLSCLNPSIESGLCTTFLTIRFSKAVTSTDRHGNTPLHCAVASRNIPSVKALLDNIDDTSIIFKKKDKNGRTAIDIASELNYTDIWKLLRDREANKRGYSQSPSHTLSPYSAQKKSKYAQEVDQERIMQIWDKFFENAFKRLAQFDDASFEEKNYSDIYLVDSSKNKKDERKQSKSNYDSFDYLKPRKQISQNSNYAMNFADCKKEYNFNDYKQVVSGNVRSGHAVKEKRQRKKKGKDISDDPYVLDDKLLAWFDWVVAYDHNFLNGEGYYVIHRTSRESLWLRDHLDRWTTQLHFWKRKTGMITDDDEEKGQWDRDEDLPSSLVEAAARTWLTYYDRQTDQCCWINLTSYNMQQVQ